MILWPKYHLYGSGDYQNIETSFRFYHNGNFYVHSVTMKGYSVNGYHETIEILQQRAAEYISDFNKEEYFSTLLLHERTKLDPNQQPI